MNTVHAFATEGPYRFFLGPFPAGSRIVRLFLHSFVVDGSGGIWSVALFERATMGMDDAEFSYGQSLIKGQQGFLPAGGVRMESMITGNNAVAELPLNRELGAASYVGVRFTSAGGGIQGGYGACEVLLPPKGKAETKRSALPGERGGSKQSAAAPKIRVQETH